MLKRVSLKKRVLLIIAVIAIVLSGVMGCGTSPPQTHSHMYKVAYPVSPDGWRHYGRSQQDGWRQQHDGRQGNWCQDGWRQDSWRQGQFVHYERPHNIRRNPEAQINLGQPHDTGRIIEAVSYEDKVPAHSVASTTSTAGRGYHIGVGDVLEVKINQLLELDREEKLLLEVDGSGQIYLPLLNHVKVASLTTTQVRQELLQRLSREYIRNPKVDVSIKHYNSKKVMVLGKVREPGALVLQSDSSTLLDVIAQSGGLVSGSGPSIEILRGGYNSDSASPSNEWNRSAQSYNSRDRLVVSVSRLFSEEGAGQVNPTIYPGDVIKVRPADEGHVYFSGEVKKPGAKTFRRPLTILQAVSCAGGTTNIAAEGKCKIIRRNEGGMEKEIIVDLKEIREGKHVNLLLARNDTIIVPVDPTKKFFDDMDKMFRRGVNAGVSVTYDAATEMGIPTAGTGGGRF
jgi:polysaccharide biosynthesis/export protein